MLKMLKVQINLELKGDPSDLDDVKERLFEVLQIAIEDDELEFTIQDDEDTDEMESED